jgi:hypothetical protein
MPNKDDWIEPDDLEYMLALLMLGDSFDSVQWNDTILRVASTQKRFSGNILRVKEWIARNEEGLLFVTEKGKRFIESGGKADA